MKQKKISYVSLGCAKNQVDFEYLIGELSNDGFIAETDPAKCDAVIINTCGFIEPAVKEAIDNILQMENLISKKAKLIVTGCMVERYKDDILKEMPEIDFITGVGKLSEAADYLRKEFNVEKHEGQNVRAITNAPYYAYVKISEGCNNTCAFCVIPNIRGRLKSRTIEDIEQEIEFLAEKGVKEIVIISQDTTQYGMDIYGEEKLIPLMKKLTERFSCLLFRMLYLNPEGVSEELIKFVAETKNVIKYFEVPVQHASDKILTKMRRASTRQVIDNVFDTIRKLCPEAFIRTTFIVGFPGETEEDFNELYKFIEDKKPDYAGFFPYYKEEGSIAYNYNDDIDEKTKKERIKKLQSLQKKNTSARLREYKKKEFICFIDKVNDDFEFILEGRAVFQAPDTDGKLYVTDGIADNGSGPYTCVINKIAYPDIYVTFVENNNG